MTTKSFINGIKNFTELTRAYSLGVSLAPWFVAFCWVFANGFYVLDAILSLIAIVCLHLGFNLYDDFVDVLLKIQKGERLNEITFCKGKEKARLITNGTYPLLVVCAIIFALFLIASAIGFYFYVLHGVAVIQIALITAILGLVYPISAKFYLSEVVISIIFGILLPKGVYLAMTGWSSTNLFLFSIALALIITPLLHAHSIMDWEFDEKNNKHTLARLCRTKKNAVSALGAMIFGAYLILGVLIALNYVPSLMLWTFITIPIGVELVRSMDDYISVKDVNFKPKWWLGPMENWAHIEKAGKAFFMYRFYLARNLATFFCLISGVTFALALLMS